MSVKLFANNIIIDLLYNLNIYIQLNPFENFLKWVVYMNTLESPCIAWIGMKSCSKFTRNLVPKVHFKDRN